MTKVLDLRVQCLNEKTKLKDKWRPRSELLLVFIILTIGWDSVSESVQNQMILIRTRRQKKKP